MSPFLAPIRGMILAAGFGTRMLPLSRFVPKALLPVAGRPLLEWNLRYLASQGVEDVVVNTHHLSGEVLSWAEAFSSRPHSRPRVRVIQEEEILGTAGGIANAAPWLTSDPVVILNVDLLFRPPLRAALAVHRAQGCLATLVCARDPLHAQIRVEGSRIAEIHPRPRFGEPGLWAFTGVYLLASEAVAHLREAAGSTEAPGRIRFAEIVPHFRAWMAEGRLGALAVTGIPFREAGSPEAYLDLTRDVEGPLGRHLLSPGWEMAKPSVMNRAASNQRVFVEDSVIFPGAVLAPGTRVRRSILGPGTAVSGEVDRLLSADGETREIRVLTRAEEEVLLPFCGAAGLGEAYFRRLHGDGSQRRIFRVIPREIPGEIPRNTGVEEGRPPSAAPGTETRIAVLSPTPEPGSGRVYPTRPGAPGETESFVYIAAHLRSLGVPVPDVVAADTERGLLLLEDLGDTLLFDRLRREDGEAGRRVLLEEALRILLLMQGEGPQPFQPERTQSPAYDEAFILTFEAGYFHREMVRGHCGWDVPFAEIEPECRAAAREALRDAPLGFMHRDYQSRNLMATPHGLHVIDFQGARLGPPEYDLAALLLDPYAALPEALRGDLLAYYLDRCPERPPERASSRRHPEDANRSREAALLRFRACGINRMMQALGAYAYLGGRLGKPGFLEHVGTAAEHLGELTGGEYPRLHALSLKLARRA